MNRLAKSFCPVYLIAVLTITACTIENPADMIITNAKILTLDSQSTIAEAMAIKDDKIFAVGTNGEIKKLAGRDSKIIDARGKTVIPGIIDAHLHPEKASLSEIEETIPDVHSMAELLDWIRGETATKQEGEWIIFPKMFFTRLAELRQPLLSELDSVAPRNPVFLNGSFGGMINSAAMSISGINELTVHKGVLRSEKSGKPSGFIRASAFSLLPLPIPRDLSDQEREDALLYMFHRYNQYGITSICSGTGDIESFTMYQELASAEKLSVRVCQNMILRLTSGTNAAMLVDQLKALELVTGDGDEWARIGAAKVFLDGGILTGTAYMREPWGDNACSIYGIRDTTYRGVVNFTPEELFAIVAAANEKGWKFTAHSTGGGGVDLLLDVYERVDALKSIQDSRFSIIHGNFFNKAAIQRMSKLGVYADMQPAWFYKDADAMRTILGDERIETFHPYRSMMDAGVMINGGSDHMVKLDANASINPYNPFLAMWSVITRTTEQNSVILPSEAISREEALRMYTINNAHASFEESIKGSIEPGKLADVAILSDDFMDCPVDKIKDIKADVTIVGGKVVYSGKEEQ